MPYYVERKVGDRWCRMLGEHATVDEAWASIKLGDIDPNMARTPSRVVHVGDPEPHPLTKTAISIQQEFSEGADLDRIATTFVEDVGRKDDAGKARYDLVPPYALEVIAKVLDYGASKYGAENWRKVENRRMRYFSAALRHLWAWRRGEHIDAESKLPHLAHAACCVLFLLEEEP